MKKHFALSNVTDFTTFIIVEQVVGSCSSSIQIRQNMELLKIF